MTTIYLVRHGQSQTNIQKVFTGQIDSVLSDVGESQAMAVKEYFKAVPIDKIISSDLVRCVQTVTPTARLKNLTVETDVGFREIYSGKWQGKSFFDIERLYPKDYGNWRKDLINCTPTGGESVKVMAQRVFSAFESVAKNNKGKSVIVSTHSVPIRAIVSNVKFGDFSKMAEVGWVPNGSVTEIKYSEGSFSVITCGDISHLGDLITELPKNI